MKVGKIKVYQFQELNDKAKERARDWYRDGALDYDWWSFIYEDAKMIGLDIRGFDLDRNRHAEGEFHESPQDCSRLIMENHGDTCDTYKIAKKYLEDRKALFESADDGQAKQYQTTDYLNDHEMDSLESLSEAFSKAIIEEYSLMLQREYEYLLSDEAVDEGIRANEYEFLEDGKRAPRGIYFEMAVNQ